MRANDRPMNQPTISLVGRHSVDDRSIKKSHRPISVGSRPRLNGLLFIRSWPTVGR